MERFLLTILSYSRHCQISEAEWLSVFFPYAERNNLRIICNRICMCFQYFPVLCKPAMENTSFLLLQKTEIHFLPLLHSRISPHQIFLLSSALCIYKYIISEHLKEVGILGVFAVLFVSML